MVIEDIVMGFTEISANSEGGFSSIFVEDKVGRGIIWGEREMAN